MTAAIELQNLSKAYGKTTVVNNVSLSIEHGEIFGLLGPNGAGKTTTLSMIEGLRQPDSGRVRVMGLDMATQPLRIKQQIGVQLQSTSLLPDVTVIEQLRLFGRLYGVRLTNEMIDTLLERVMLTEKRHAVSNKLSGGQQQRLSLAIALVNDPEIIFLDEPTAGLDPQSRHVLWEIVQGLSDEGRTVVLTTHYMEEAQALAHRVGILDHGELLAVDTPAALINEIGGLSTITVNLPMSDDTLRQVDGVQSVSSFGKQKRILTGSVTRTNTALMQLAAEQGIMFDEWHVQQPSLEDVFLKLTGRSLREQ